MILHILDVLLKSLSPILLLIALLFLVSSFGFSVKTVRNRLRVASKVQHKKIEKTLHQKPIFQYYNRLLLATSKSYHPRQFSTIVYIQTLICISMFYILFLQIHDVFFSLIVAVIATIICPIVILWLRLYRIRSSSQDNFGDTIVIFMQEYNKQHRNIIYALKNTTERLEGDSKFVYSMLLFRLEANTIPREEAAAIFSYQMGDSYGMNLSIDILRGLHGIDISLPLQILLKNYVMFSNGIKEAKTNGRETAQLGKLPLFATPLLMFLNAKFAMQLDAWNYYFNTSVGLKTVIVSMCMAVFAFMLSIFLQKPKQR